MRLLSSQWRTKLNTRQNILLAVIWSAVISTGILALGAIVGSVEGLAVFSMIHSFMVRVGFAYTVIHVLIYSAFGGGTKWLVQKIRQHIFHTLVHVVFRYHMECHLRTIKIIMAITFHIILHMISVRLAVAYTIFHIVQHRKIILSLFKKSSFKKSAFKHSINLKGAYV